MVGWVAAATAAISLALAGLLRPARSDTSPLDAPTHKDVEPEAIEVMV